MVIQVIHPMMGILLMAIIPHWIDNSMGVDGMSSTKMGTFPNFPTISWAFYADFMGYSCGYDGVSLYTMVKSWVVSREWNGRGTILLFPQVVEDYMSVNTTRYLS